MRTVRLLGRILAVKKVRLYSTSNSLYPIKIAYFGTDKFSSVSLDALESLRKDRPDLISDICIITRPPKFTGRKRDVLKESDVSLYCKSRDLPFHTADSKFQISGLDLADIDLTVAVSYGLLIPGSFLSDCKYGGINLHPSLLPVLSGPSPISSAILRGLHYTGVTIQTLHPTMFDKGEILVRSDSVPISSTDTTQSLSEKLAIVGAQCLVQTLSKRLYSLPRSELRQEGEATMTAKVTRDSRQIQWNDPDKGTGEYIDRQIRALGCSSPLWTRKYFFKTETMEDIQLDGMKVLKSESIPDWIIQQQQQRHQTEHGKLIAGGSFYVNPYEFKDQHLYICPVDSYKSIVQIERVKRQGKGFVTGRDFALSVESDWSRYGGSDKTNNNVFNE